LSGNIIHCILKVGTILQNLLHIFSYDKENTWPHFYVMKEFFCSHEGIENAQKFIFKIAAHIEQKWDEMPNLVSETPKFLITLLPPNLNKNYFSLFLRICVCMCLCVFVDVCVCICVCCVVRGCICMCICMCSECMCVVCIGSVNGCVYV
jgi:hypothetical protein